MRKETRCDTCGKLTMVALEEVYCAIYFASQWCKCSEKRENAVSDNTRDTQFKGFAKLLLEEIDKITDDFCREPFDKGASALIRDIYASDVYEKKIQTLVTCRAYDLVKHAFKDAYSFCVEDYDPEDIIKLISDITELPKELS